MLRTLSGTVRGAQSYPLRWPPGRWRWRFPPRREALTHAATLPRRRNALYPRTCGSGSLPAAMPSLRKRDARVSDRGVQLEMPGGSRAGAGGSSGCAGHPDESSTGKVHDAIHTRPVRVHRSTELSCGGRKPRPPGQQTTALSLSRRNRPGNDSNCSRRGLSWRSTSRPSGRWASRFRLRCSSGRTR